MGAFKTYDADQVSVLINGIELKGYADGEFLRIEQEGADFTDVVGTDGEVTRSKTNDRSRCASAQDGSLLRIWS